MEYRLRTWASKRDRTANKRRTYYKLEESSLSEEDAPFDEDFMKPIKPVKSPSFGKTACTSVSTPDRTDITSVSTPFDEVSQQRQKDQVDNDDDVISSRRPIGEITIQWDPSFDNQVSFLGEESVDHHRKDDYMMQINEGKAILAIKSEDDYSYYSDSSMSAPADDLLIKMGEISFDRQETLLEIEEEDDNEGKSSPSIPYDEDQADSVKKLECIIEEELPSLLREVSLPDSMDTSSLERTTSLPERVKRLIKKRLKKRRKDMRKRLKKQRKKMNTLEKRGQSAKTSSSKSGPTRRMPWCSQSRRRGGGIGIGGVANKDESNQEQIVMFGEAHNEDDKSVVLIPIIDDTPPTEIRIPQKSKKKKKKKIWNRISIKPRSNSPRGPYPIEHGKRLNSNEASSQEDNSSHESSQEEDLSSKSDDGSISGRWSSFGIGGLGCASELPTDMDEYMPDVESPAELAPLRPQLSADCEDAVCEMLEGGFEMIHSAVGSSVDVFGVSSSPGTFWKKENDLDAWYKNRVPDENASENKSSDNPMKGSVIFHTLPSEKKAGGIEESKSISGDDSVYQTPNKSVVQSMASHRGRRRPTRSGPHETSRLLSSSIGLSFFPWSSPSKKKQDWSDDRVPASDDSAAERSSLQGTKFIDNEKNSLPKKRSFLKTARIAFFSLNSCNPSKALEAVPNTDTMSESESESHALNPLDFGSFRVMYEI